MKSMPRSLLVNEHDLEVATLNAKKKVSKVCKVHTTSGGLKLGKSTMKWPPYLSVFV
jgi:hypothetical protein